MSYRLADALPAEALKNMLETSRSVSDPAYRRKVEAWLDAGQGACHLRSSAAASLVVEAWKHFADERYHLHAWVVMPNHVHLLVQMIRPHSLGAAVESWKRFTATRINRMLGRSGKFWHPDYWDRYIRDEHHYRAVVRYIHENPVKAGLVQDPKDWPWSSASAQ